MLTLQVTFFAVLAFAGVGILYTLIEQPKHGSALIAAILSAGFAAYTAVQIWADGVMMFWTNHTGNLTGIQVWWDLVMCVVVALFFIIPRARKVGMNVWLWTLFAACTASIGVLAMCARLFWLEQAQNAESTPKASSTANPNPAAKPAA